MVEASTRLKEEPQPPHESILPREYETFEQWDRRITRMLKEFRARE